jgi:hypothetical protein
VPPTASDAEVLIETERFEPSVRDRLPGFFRRAFERDAARRRDSAEPCGWLACFLAPAECWCRRTRVERGAGHRRAHRAAGDLAVVAGAAAADPGCVDHQRVSAVRLGGGCRRCAVWLARRRLLQGVF